MRTAWKGSIQCGLLVIPVRLGLTASDPKTMFHQIHSGCGGRIKQRRFCSADGAEVEWADIAKGAEIPGRDNLVQVTDDELEQLRDWENKTIRIDHFTPAGTIDPLLYEAAYHVAPGEGAQLPCALLRDAMVQASLSAVCRIGFPTRDALGLLDVRDGRFLFARLRWPAEMREADQDSVIDPAATPRPQELKMAASLLKSMTRPFDPAAHVDTYREAIGALLLAKANGTPAALPRPAASPAPDLTAVLKQSIAAIKTIPKTTTRKAS